MENAIREVALREVAASDLPVFFDQQLDPGANRMAAFGAPDPEDRLAFDAHWARNLTNPGAVIRTVVLGVEGEAAGYVASYEMEGERHVGYWLGREFWGRGIASEALQQMVAATPERPLRARVAHDNRASARVLEKCGFRVIGREMAYSVARGEETEELVLELR